MCSSINVALEVISDICQLLDFFNSIAVAYFNTGCFQHNRGLAILFGGELNGPLDLRFL